MIPAEAVEAAHKAWREQAAQDGSIFEYNLRAALEAAAPYMLAECEAEALEDAAAAFPSYGPERVPVDAITWLQERAALIRKGVHP